MGGNPAVMISAIPRVFAMASAPSQSAERVREHLHRVLSSAEFRNSRRMQQFLIFVVETTLTGKPVPLKEQVIGIEVFDRCAATYNPSHDPIVRNEARRLRRKLELYYEAEGRTESLRIEIPKGRYAPVFSEKDPDPSLPNSEPQDRVPDAPKNRKFTLRVAVPVCAVLVLAVLWATWRLEPRFSHAASARQLEARQEYTLGRRMLTDEDLLKRFAFPHLQRAIQLDPKYADAYAGLGIAYSMAVTRRQLPEAGNWQYANQLFQKALALDPNSSEAYVGLAAMKTYDADFVTAERFFRQSIALRPGDAFTHFVYARLLLLPQGRLDEAAEEVQKSVDLDPTNPIRSLSLCLTQIYRQDWPQAIAAGKRALRNFGPTWTPGYEIVAEAYARGGRWNEFTPVISGLPFSDANRLWIEIVAADAVGNQKQVRQLAGQLLATEPDELKRAKLFSLRRDWKNALICLHMSAQTQKLATRTEVRNAHYFDSMRANPEFQNLLRSLDLR
jgi:tetratricopeptide (TPR) repeat protein